MNDYVFIFINVFGLIIWFKTEAFLEYFKYIPVLNKIFRIDEFEDFRLLNPEMNNYQTFLLVEHNCFFIRLITCPICLNVWMNILSLFFLNNIYNFFINFVFSLLIYNISCVALNFNKHE